MSKWSDIRNTDGRNDASLRYDSTSRRAVSRNVNESSALSVRLNSKPEQTLSRYRYRSSSSGDSVGFAGRTSKRTQYSLNRAMERAGKAAGTTIRATKNVAGSAIGTGAWSATAMDASEPDGGEAPPPPPDLRRTRGSASAAERRRAEKAAANNDADVSADGEPKRPDRRGKNARGGKGKAGCAVRAAGTGSAAATQKAAQKTAANQVKKPTEGARRAAKTARDAAAKSSSAAITAGGVAAWGLEVTDADSSGGSLPPVDPRKGGAKSRTLMRALKKTRQRLAWRAATRRSMAAKRALKGAAKSSATAAATTAKAAGAATVATAAAAAPVSTPIIAAAMATMLVVLSIVGVVFGITDAKYEEMHGRNGGEVLAKWAIREYESGVADGTMHAGGQKYWSHAGFGGRDEWCSCFVMTGWDECGFNKTIGPGGNAMANSWVNLVADNPSMGKLIKADSSYNPKPGDIIVCGEVHGVSVHVGIVVEGLDGNGRFRTVEGNSPDIVATHYYFPGSYWNWVFRPNYPNSGGTTFGEGVNFNMSKAKFVKEWGPRIDKWLAANYGPAPLQGYGNVWAAAAWEEKVDPRVSPAIALHESGLGRIPWYPYGIYDAFGWRAALPEFSESWEAAIYAHVARWSHGYFEGVTDLAEWVHIYAPESDGNDEVGYREDLERALREI